tara:strand:+ start:948 stop:1226 length:279 start_codon:yes stop_codon:yes gene_type:complete
MVMTTAKLGGKTIRFKKGALRKQLKVGPKTKLTRAVLGRMKKTPVGSMVTVPGTKRKMKMTSLMKKRITLGINLQSRKKKKSPPRPRKKKKY